MTTSKVDKKQRKKSINILKKEKLKEAPGFVKFTHYFSKALILIGVIVSAYAAYRTSLRSPYWFEYLMPLAYFGAIYGLSFMMFAVYKGWALGKVIKDYSLPFSATDETLSYDGTRIIHSYRDDSRGDGANISNFIFTKDAIQKIDYNKEARLITIYGEIPEERYKADVLVSTITWGKVTLINTFKDLDLFELLQ